LKLKVILFAGYFSSKAVWAVFNEERERHFLLFKNDKRILACPIFTSGDVYEEQCTSTLMQNGWHIRFSEKKQ
jgi:hypothetical protein